MGSTRFILNTAGWGSVCERAVLADGPWTRLRGLLGRSELPAGEGMLFHPTAAIHTAFMRFPIDVVFLDNDYRVLSFAENVGPWRTAANRKARFTLELAAGEVQRRGIAPGDQLLVLPQDPAAPVEQESDLGPAAVTVQELPAGGRKRARGRRAPEPETERPAMTVLIASRDRRFRTVASALLERRGWQVSGFDEPGRVPRLAAGLDADVIVLDQDRSLIAPVQVVAQIGAAAPGMGVVLVGDGTDVRVGRPLVHPKWGVFDDLVDAIEDAYWHRGAHKVPA
jgi:uncharacterized membrane protein (UPF0127 family)